MNSVPHEYLYTAVAGSARTSAFSRWSANPNQAIPISVTGSASNEKPVAKNKNPNTSPAITSATAKRGNTLVLSELRPNGCVAKNFAWKVSPHFVRGIEPVAPNFSNLSW